MEISSSPGGKPPERAFWGPAANPPGGRPQGKLRESSGKAGGADLHPAHLPSRSMPSAVRCRRHRTAVPPPFGNFRPPVSVRFCPSSGERCHRHSLRCSFRLDRGRDGQGVRKKRENGKSVILPPECGRGLQLSHGSHNCALALAARGPPRGRHGSGNPPARGVRAWTCVLPCRSERPVRKTGQEERAGRAGRKSGQEERAGRAGRKSGQEERAGRAGRKSGQEERAGRAQAMVPRPSWPVARRPDPTGLSVEAGGWPASEFNRPAVSRGRARRSVNHSCRRIAYCHH